MNHRRLSDEEFRNCCVAPMRDVTATANAVIDIWPYVDSLDLDELGIPSLSDVRYIYRDGSDCFDQVLIGTGRFNTLLIVLVDLREASVFGHFLLDLNEAYGADGEHLKLVQ